MIAEVNDQVPDIGCDRRLSRDEHRRHRAYFPAAAEYPATPAGDIEAAIARHVADLIPDGATIQFGIGRLPPPSCVTCAATATSACTPG